MRSLLTLRLLLTTFIFIGVWCPTLSTVNAQLLPWRRYQEQRLNQQQKQIDELLRQNQELLKQIFERRGEPIPQPAPQIILMPSPYAPYDPYQKLPIERDPRQRLPVEPDPRQKLPVEPDPRQKLPIEPKPPQVLPVEPKPRYELPGRGKGLPQQLPLDTPVPQSRPKGPPTGYQKFTISPWR